MQERYRSHRHNQRRNAEPFSMLTGTWALEGVSPFIALAVCMLLSIGIYIGSSSFASFNVGKFRWTATSTADDASLAPFRLAKLQMGMTAAEMASIFPEMTFTGDPDGKQLGSYKFGNATYTVTFMGPEAGRKAFRIGYDETFLNYSEDELHQRLKSKFGQPNVNHCAMESPRRGWECQLQWQRADGVYLDAVTKTIHKFNGDRITELNFAAVDKRLESRFFESAQVTSDETRFNKRKKIKNRAFMRRMRAISKGARNL